MRKSGTSRAEGRLRETEYYYARPAGCQIDREARATAPSRLRFVGAAGASSQMSCPNGRTAATIAHFFRAGPATASRPNPNIDSAASKQVDGGSASGPHRAPPA